MHFVKAPVDLGCTWPWAWSWSDARSASANLPIFSSAFSFSTHSISFSLLFQNPESTFSHRLLISFFALFRRPQYLLRICCHEIILFTSDGHRHHLVLVSREPAVLAEYDGSNSPKERLPFAISLTNILNNFLNMDFLYRSLAKYPRAMGDWIFTAYCRQACSTNLQIVRRQCSLSYCPKLETF